MLLLSLLGLDRGLWTPDEPREAEIGREMLLAPGVIPTLNGEQFIEKPPLYYWTVALAYRIAGAPSPAAARSVSGVAGFLTLLAIGAWGLRAASAGVGTLGAVILATSLQFLQSSHWVLIDPLLTLFTTVAAWAAWEALQAPRARGCVAGLYAGLILALWTKGLIGPVLIGAGLAMHALLERRVPWRELALLPGALVMAAALGLLGAAIYWSGGFPAFYEWAWVNHVQRFTDPGATGHRQQMAYYLWTIPFAALPWIMPLVVSVLPGSFRGEDRTARLRRYCGALTLGMLVILSASATKRGIYVLPVLPLLALLAASLLVGAFEGVERRPTRLWWAQLICCVVVAVSVPLGAMAYAHQPDWLVVPAIIAPIAAWLSAAVASRRRSAVAMALLAWGALLMAGAAVVLAPRLFEANKDLRPLVSWLDARLPPGEPVYAVNSDETLVAIIPFVSGRRVIPVALAAVLDSQQSKEELPARVLVQEKSGRISLTPRYRVLDSFRPGTGRALTLWALET
jgi:4-amino-4-deoxy-L-arabinose transferase-like glycosyltransferase